MPLMIEIIKLLEKSGKAELFTIRDNYVVKFLSWFKL
jgi:hypothetical protein